MKDRRLMVLACIFLLLLTGLIIFDYRDEIAEELLKIDARDKLKTPSTATFLGRAEYNTSKGLVRVLTWKENRTLYEAIYDHGNDMVSMNIFTLRSVEINSTITPSLATMIAEKVLSTETRFYPGHPMLSEPSVGFEKYFTDIGMWRVEWTLHVGNYSILGSYFAVRVNSATGNPRVYINKFRNVDEVSPPNPPTVMEEQAIEIARTAFNDSIGSAVIDSVKVRDLGLTAPSFVDEPYQMVWEIVVRGTGIENDRPVRIDVVYLIDAYDGTILTWTSYGVGISSIQ